MDRTPNAFRATLRRDLPRWREEGLVTPDAAAVLSARYDLDETLAGHPTVLAIYVLGALLVGAGVVTLVAWHWEELGRGPRLAILLTTLFLAHGAALALHRAGGHPRLAHGIAVLASLVFGANIALVAQVFQVSGRWYGIFGGFAAGAAATGVLLASFPTLLLAAIAGGLLWGPGFASDHPLLGIAAAWAVAGVSGWWAVRERSRALALVGAAGLAIALSAALHGGQATLALLTLSSALAAVPLVARGDAAARLAPALRLAGRVAFVVATFQLSFVDEAKRALLGEGTSPELLFAVLLPAALAGILFAPVLRRDDVEPLAWLEALVAVGSMVALLAALSFPRPMVAAVIANVALVALATERIASGLARLERAPFWEGMAVALVVLVARFVEIEHLLWLKGTAFIACGAAVMAAGVLFERRLGREVVHAR